MASDDSYMDFLNKANADTNAGQEPEQGIKTQAVDNTLKCPASLKEIKVDFVSEADEPFEPVLLRWKGASEGKWPSADELSSLISPNADLSSNISTLETSSFDPRNQYKEVLQAVRSATAESDPAKVDIKVYSVQLTSTTLEYYVLALDSAEDGRIIGLRAKSVES